jgi:flagellar biogenesis protein FliO
MRYARILMWAAYLVVGTAAGQSQEWSPPPEVNAPPARRPAVQVRRPVEPLVANSPSEGAADGAPHEAPLPLIRARLDPALAPPTTHAERGVGGTTATVLASLAIVLGAFFLFVWIARRSMPRAMAPLPSEVVESLGRAPLAARQQMQLIRLGSKLVLLCVTPHGAAALAEVTDAAEVDRLSGLCQQNRAGSITQSFRQVLIHAGQSRHQEHVSARVER